MEFGVAWLGALAKGSKSLCVLQSPPCASPIRVSLSLTNFDHFDLTDQGKSSVPVLPRLSALITTGINPIV